jgi:membrane-associated phospholipid phosphatase
MPDAFYPDESKSNHAAAFERAGDECADMTRIFLARTLSIIGHPAILTPVAAVLSAVTTSAPAKTLQLLVLVSLCLGVSITAYSWIQVRSGRWLHVDASVPRERRQLHWALLLLFWGVAAALWLSGQPQRLALGPACCGLLIVLASLLRHWLKMSLHASFAVFAAALLWPDVAGTSILLILALAVAWSRLTLRRHTRQEVAVGLLLGGTIGIAFNVVSAA